MSGRFSNASPIVKRVRPNRQHRTTPVAAILSVTSSSLARPSRLANHQTENVAMAWTLLSLAGFLEIGFAFGMKWSAGFTRLIPGLYTAVTGLSSIFLLSLSLRTLPVGTGYAVWTGIGAAGTAILGMTMLGDSASPLRMFCIGLILAGVIGLKLVSES
jgi:quaternary ammonium compound-resistance protein SugE